jgi:two-component system, chemotaxis family, protein-glutamate methylesterase/glutaminase
MFALPPALVPDQADRVSGITCPVCHGCLAVRAEGAGHLHFTCRVGHSLSLREVLTSLEQYLEDTLWNAIRGSEELVALLDDVIAYRARLPEVTPDGSYEPRRRRAAEQVRVLRALVDGDEPITFSEEPSGGERPGAVP